MALSRRNFMEKTALGIGAGLIGFPNTSPPKPKSSRLPREVWIGSVSTMRLRAKNAEDMVQYVLRVMESFIPYEPDIICLPESFAFSNIQQRVKVTDISEEMIDQITGPIAEFAKVYKCYVICPTYSRDQDGIYIAAFLIDRKGNIVGEYRKARPVDSEMASGVRPGPLYPPVFETDFGKIGIQICFDIKWNKGWEMLKAKGAEIIFWPSAYAGGKEISSRAWRHQVHLVSSTQKDTSKICDLSGEVIAQTNRWQPNWVCAPINLEKIFLNNWPAVKAFPEIQKKYGRRIKITTLAEEEWTIIESLDPALKVSEIFDEFGLRSQYDFITDVEQMQQLKR